MKRIKILFACDLDNTLIYSYKHKKDGDICIEWIGDREQGYMTQRAYELLKEVVNKVIFVPVTTRSIEQYSRIKWNTVVEPKYAITTNGGVILDRYKVSKEWDSKTDKCISGSLKEIKRMKELLIEQNKFKCCSIIDNKYLVAYCKDGISAIELIDRYKNITDLNIERYKDNKLYFFPYEINKGNAVKQLKKMLGAELLICAGDDKFDISMLNIADISIVPYSGHINNLIRCSDIRICKDREPFQEFVLKTILEIVNKWDGGG